MLLLRSITTCHFDWMVLEGRAIIESVSVYGAIIESAGTIFQTDATKSQFALT